MKPRIEPLASSQIRLTEPGTADRSFVRRLLISVARWFDTSANDGVGDDDDRVDFSRVIPFIGMHLACLAVIWVGFSWFALWTAVALYAVRMFAITGFYHRYFAHRAFKASRPVQFIGALVGASAVQRGPLWWAAHHRNHHRHADTPADVHSPVQHGFLHSHVGWFLSRRGFRTDVSVIPDLMRYRELRLLDRFDLLVPLLLAVGLYFLGGWLGAAYPALGTSGLQLLTWGFFISTVVLFHATVTINSLAHRFGRRRFDTRDNSRNNWLLAIVTFGEGWHNNHHFFPGSARQGFRWWEVDLTFYILRTLSLLGVVRELRAVPVGLKRTRQAS